MVILSFILFGNNENNKNISFPPPYLNNQNGSAFNLLREAGIKFRNSHEITRLRTFVEKFSDVELSIDVFTQKVMDEDLCIQGIVISEEMKRQAIEYFLINNIPLTYINYNVYIRGIVNSIKQEEQRGC